MEKAILKTLIYSDLFDYPLTIREVHRWLISKKADLRDIENSLMRLQKKKKIGNSKDFYFLTNRETLINKRLKKKAHSIQLLQKAKLIASVLKIIPWIKLIGISGGLSMMNAGVDDDIDFFIITSHRRIYLSRILILL